MHERLFFPAALWAVLGLLTGCGSSSNPIPSPLSNLSTPKTLLDRAIEARSVEAITIDTGVYLSANAIILEHGAFSLTTEIYEGHLLITGLVNQVEACPALHEAMAAINGVEHLHWHVLCVAREEQRDKGVIGEFRRALLRAKASLRLFGEAGVADVNMRIAIDPQRNAVLLGRARSERERQAAIEAAAGDGINNVIAYIDVRP